ncbi:LEAF RUST 10 DISEASE-RESISTANCE LOCUS RECEPTOR-LIKE PROTEIN KINASE-like 2.1 isoform X1 [Lactuca sativa]|uniref:LEAF RUST 10 DISEASE-RESISTANCE LOCUS RECEPTOR-LIKE PROTEIN KINASE-like 2.1 isoform X1 n=1 Tax=Lactuca sativa TaxID=4236 RepID=UPI000CD9EADD|nr:LEAF RUST 10 DISEASE-RESISTANCE LOCUS RECEPTOR-LIKE PROTEIN KINASE-like 2.1 isoform X1 [Lactuca sativa]
MSSTDVSFSSIFVFLFPILSFATIQQFNECSTTFYACDQSITYISYPFWGNGRPSYCGLEGFELTCREDNITTLQINNTTFRVGRIDQNNTKLTLALDDLWEGDQPNACLLRPNESIDLTTFRYTFFSYVPDGSLFLGIYFSCLEDVVRSIPNRNRFNCSGDEDGRVSFIGNRSIAVGDACERVIGVPVLRTAFEDFNRSETMPLQELLWMGFQMEYRVDGGGICSRCQRSGGSCWSNLNSSTPSCICPDGVSSLVCGSGSPTSLRIKLAFGIGSALLLIVLIFIIYCIRKSSTSSCVALFKHQTEDDKSVETFVIQYGSLSTKRYTYADIKKMTNSFQVKLGQGGFGTVFKGKLSDGRLVAVKLLNSSKASGQEFINEVASIGRTSHVNIVTLLGFCFDNQKRALIYEFMPNGSLEKFKYGHVSQCTSEHIGVDKLYEIALGIARGLDYLHRGCNTRILHLDIKPHNILLDEDFCPKIADFGLAKLYSRKDSIVSMLEARGTIGYIAPEVFNRNFGGVSHKSDVYSYGMLILEMVGGRNNVYNGVGSEDTSEIMYFPNWIYSRLKTNEFLFDGVTSSTENEYVRKMTIVSLWCIQTNPKQRPSINEVIEMLEGSMEALEIPPKPFFSSPPRSPTTMFNISQEVTDEHSCISQRT